MHILTPKGRNWKEAVMGTKQVQNIGRKIPWVCGWQAGALGELTVWFQAQPMSKDRRVTALRQAERENSLSSSICSTQAFSGLHEAHPHWGGQYALLSLLISSWNTLTDIPRIMVNQTPRHHMIKWSWHIKLTITGHGENEASSMLAWFLSLLSVSSWLLPADQVLS